MFKPFLIGNQLCLTMTAQGFPQFSTQSAISTHSCHPPPSDKESWQRLYWMLSVTFIFVAKEGQTEPDSSLFIASRSLGLSRFSLLAEGIGDLEMLEHAQWLDRKDPGSAVRLLSQATGKKSYRD